MCPGLQSRGSCSCPSIDSGDFAAAVDPLYPQLRCTQGIKSSTQCTPVKTTEQLVEVCDCKLQKRPGHLHQGFPACKCPYAADVGHHSVLERCSTCRAINSIFHMHSASVQENAIVFDASLVREEKNSQVKVSTMFFEACRSQLHEGGYDLPLLHMPLN